MTVEKIAEICHETNKAYCEAVGDYSQVHWDQAPDWQKESAIAGVNFYVNNMLANPIDMHASWMKKKIEDGWKWGAVKDPEKKEHPCIVPYENLPEEQRVKDTLFIAVIRALAR